MASSNQPENFANWLCGQDLGNPQVRQEISERIDMAWNQNFTVFNQIHPEFQDVESFYRIACIIYKIIKQLARTRR